MAGFQFLLQLRRDLVDVGCDTAEIAALHAGIDVKNRLDIGLVGGGGHLVPFERRHIAEHARHGLTAHRQRGGNRRVSKRIQRVDFVLRRLHGQIIRNSRSRIGPEVWRYLLRRAETDIDVGGHRARIEAKLRGPGPIDLGVESRSIDFLLQMRVDDARNRGKALTELPCNRKIVLVVAHRPDVDLRRQSEVQNLRYDIGRLEIEYVLRECGGQYLTQFLDVVGGRLVALLERHVDDAIVDPDRRAVGECQIVASRWQSDIVDDQRAVLVRNDLANLVLNRLKYRLGAFNAGPGGSANVKLDLPPVEERKKIPANKQEHHRAEADHQHGDDRDDGPPLKQHREEFRISIAQSLEAAVECGGHPREEACWGPLVRVATFTPEQQADRDRRQGPRQSVGSQHRKHDGKS